MNIASLVTDDMNINTTVTNLYLSEIPVQYFFFKNIQFPAVLTLHFTKSLQSMYFSKV